MKNSLKLFILLLSIVVDINAQNPVKHIPAFTLYTLDNIRFTTADIRQDKRIFFVFFDSSCEHCQHAMHQIDLHINSFKETAVYLVTLDRPEAIANFMSVYAPHLSHQSNVTILRDLRNEFIVKFNPRKYPSMLLYSATGSLIVYEDDDTNISNIYNRL